MIKKDFTLTKWSCFITCFSTAITGNLSPILFLTFRSLYGISYTLLGFIVFVFFGLQLIIDLVFSFFSHKFNLSSMIKLTPILMTVGLWFFAAAPIIFPNSIYIGLIIGTIIFSSGSGLSEVLSSPIITAIAPKNSDRLLAKLHSCYAWGVVAVVVISTAFLFIFGNQNWQYLTIILSVLPLLSSIFILLSPIPEMDTPDSASGAAKLFKNKTYILCVLCIFCGGATECVMSNWCSSYLEQAMGIPKIYGDLLGMALFGVMLGLGRSLYGKFGKNIYTIMVLGASLAIICYLTTAITTIPVIGLFSCALTGLCASMLWPGNLMLASERVVGGGVAMFAIMAAGGDMGAALCPQLVGIITDTTMSSQYLNNLLSSLSLSPEQLGMKTGMLFATIFPILTLVCLILLRKKKNN